MGEKCRFLEKTLFMEPLWGILFRNSIIMGSVRQVIRRGRRIDKISEKSLVLMQDLRSFQNVDGKLSTLCSTIF